MAGQGRVRSATLPDKEPTDLFVLLSKTLDLLLSPLSWALLLALAGLVVGRLRPRLGTALGVGGVVVLWLFATSPVSNALLRILEASAVRTYRPEQTYDAVILLGGMLEPEATESTGEPQYTGSAERLLRTFELLREGKARSVIITAGTIDPRPQAVVEGQVLARQLIRWGIDPARIIVEGSSRNTRENALFTAPLVRAHQLQSLVLVTSAAHLARALGCFKAAGLSPDTLPVDFNAYDPHRQSGSWIPRAGPLAQSTDALRELAGRAVYRALGYATN